MKTILIPNTMCKISTVLILVLSISACGGNGSSECAGCSGQSVLAQKTIGSAGGSLQIENQTDPLLAGAGIDIPADALDSDQTISIGTINQYAAIPENFAPAGKALEFSPDGTQFATEVTIYLPYNDTDNNGVIDGTQISENDVLPMVFNSSQNAWQSALITDLNPQDNIVTIKTSHFSVYLVMVSTSTSTSGTDTTGTPLETGDYFLRNYCCNPYYLTVFRRTSLDPDLTLYINHTVTMVSGYPAAIDAGATSATFNPLEMFDRVKQSGSAMLWDWKCSFVPEHTNLLNYEAVDDTITDITGTGILCDIEAIDDETVKIDWQINVADEITYRGQHLVVSFEATYR